jgi:hypothetical protein
MWTGRRGEKEKRGRAYGGLFQDGEDLGLSMHLEEQKDRYTAPMFLLQVKLLFACYCFLDSLWVMDAYHAFRIAAQINNDQPVNLVLMELNKWMSHRSTGLLVHAFLLYVFAAAFSYTKNQRMLQVMSIGAIIPIRARFRD